jgi:basic membrane lipoprotein Med (substrate-binding protein (PBP1-ABC) superfamily)
MTPTIEYLIAQVNAGTFTGMDLKDFSMVSKGGAFLADFHGMDAKIPAEVLAKVKETEQQIKDGLFRVDIKEEPPVSD